jgi:histidinol-phosphate aminotransferase
MHADLGPGAIVGWLRQHATSEGLAGAAFLVRPDIAVTCAHVIKAHVGAQEVPSAAALGEITIRFEALQQEVKGHVLDNGWFANTQPQPGKLSDIAIVRLERSLPLEPLPAIAQRMPTQRSSVLIHGAEAGYQSYGQQVQGDLLGSNLANGRRQIDPKDSARGFTIARGFSGSPVLDDLGNVVWGMISAVAREGTGVAYTITAGDLHAALSAAGVETDVRIPDATDRLAEATMAELRVKYERWLTTLTPDLIDAEIDHLRAKVRRVANEARNLPEEDADKAFKGLYLLPRPGIMGIAPYVGGESKAPGAVRPIRLASNESALGPSPDAIAAYRALAGEIYRYPDGGAADLRLALGRHHNLHPDRIVCGAGSDELIGLLLRAYAGPGDEVLYSEHGFLMYPIGAMAVGAVPVAVPEQNLTADVDEFLARITERTRIVFVANPNNPTGTYLPANEIARLHAGLPPHIVLAIDAAYAEFVNRNDYEAGVTLVNRAENVVMLRTFSKIYALAGLRLGWAYCPPAIADVLHRIRGPFNVSAPALAAGVAAVEDTESLALARAHNERWQPWLFERLAGLGLPLTPSVGNFVLPRFPDRPRHDAESAFAFLQSRGILTRKVAAYGLPQHLRITIGTGEEMEIVAAALAEFMAAP